MNTNIKQDNTPINSKGLKIQTWSRVVAVIGLLLLVLVGINLRTIVSNYKNLVDEFDLHMDSHEYISALQNGSDDMTEQSRLFVVTKDPVHMQKYFEIVDNHVRENAKDRLAECFRERSYVSSLESLSTALDESNALMDFEIHAMKLMVLALHMDEKKIPEPVKNYSLSDSEENLPADEKQALASQLVFGEEYLQKKTGIDSDIQAAVLSMSEKLENDTSAGINSLGKQIALMITLCILLGILFIFVFVLISVLVIRPLKVYVKCVKENRLFDIVGSYEFKYLALTYNKIFEINRANHMRLNFMLEHDTLTNASSRLAFEEQKKILSHAKIPIALLIFDLDNFKKINDTYGHETGDKALIRVADTARSLLRSGDIVARIGGDEFAVVLMNVYEYREDVIGTKLEKLNQLLLNPDDGSPALSLSIGAAFSEHGYSETLFQQADQALYEAKAAGRACYKIYSPASAESRSEDKAEESPRPE